MSVRCYEQAIALRPDYALAHAGLADSYSLLTTYGARHPRETVILARAAAEKAARHNCLVASAAGHTSLALITAMHDWQWAEAERLFRHAIAIDPNYPTAHHWLAVDLLMPRGRFAEAAAELEIARRLDPLSAIIAEARGFQLMLQRRYEEALAANQLLRELDPHFYMAPASMGRTLIQMGRYEEAVAKFEEAKRLILAPSFKVEAGYAQALALAGRRDEAHHILDRLILLSKTRYVPSTTLAIIEMGLSNLDAALTHTETAVESHESSASLYGVHPLYDPLRSNPRFEKLLERMDLLTVSNKR